MSNKLANGVDAAPQNSRIAKLMDQIDQDCISVRAPGHSNAQDSVHSTVNFSISDVLSRPYFFSVKWGTTDIAMEFGYAASTILPLITAPADMPLNSVVLKDKVKNFAYVRYKSIHCRLNINATPFQAGALVLYWVPYDYIRDDAHKRSHSLSQVLRYRHVIINLAENSSGELEVPWEYWDQWAQSKDALSKVGSFYVGILSDLTGPTNAELTHVNIAVHWKGAQVAFPSSKSIDLQSDNTLRLAHPDQLESEKGRLNALADAEHRVAVAEANRDRDNVQDNARGLVNRTGTDIAQAQGVREDRAIGQHGHVKFKPSKIAVPRELLLSHMASEWTIFAKINWNTTTEAGARLGDIPIAAIPDTHVDTVTYRDSADNDQSYDVMLPGSPSFAAANFHRWRGDIEIKVMPINTSFHTGALLFSYSPNGGGHNLTAASTMHSKLWSIKQTQASEDTEGAVLSIPFNNSVPYRRPRDDMGILCPVVANPLIAPDTVASNINIFLLYRIVNFRGYVHGVHKLFLDYKPIIATPATLQSQNDLAPITYSKGDSSNNNENWDSVLQIAHRPSLYATIAKGNEMQIWPYNFIQGLNEGDPKGVYYRFPDFLSAVSAGFAYFSGSFRATLVPENGGPVIMYGSMKIGQPDAVKYDGGTKTDVTTTGLFNYSNSRHVAVYEQNVQYNFANPVVPLGTDVISDEKDHIVYTVGATEQCRVLLSAGEDFMLYSPVAFPVMTIADDGERF